MRFMLIGAALAMCASAEGAPGKMQGVQAGRW